MRKRILLVTTLLLVGSSIQPVLALDITVRGLFKDGAILIIDGKQHMLRAGERSPEGVLLVAADTENAVLEIDGERRTLGMSRGISTRFSEAEKAQARIPSGRGGHYVTPGRINGQAVQFMVDTGATSVAMNLPTAKRLGINYRAGRQGSSTTANGVVATYRIMLDSVRVGGVEVSNVEGVVLIGDYPEDILLGNSFLNRVDLRRESGVLVLEARF